MGLDRDARPLPGRIQIAGVIDRSEADLLVSLGVNMLGFPQGLGDGREDLGVEEASDIIGSLPSSAVAVCITYLHMAEDISDLCQRLHTPWVQLHGKAEAYEVVRLRQMCPGLGIIKSLIVHPVGIGNLANEINIFEPIVDAFITDTFDPETGRSGATGKTHDWRISRKVVESTRRPVILAGGLTATNVADAIAAVRPAAVDAHTGVEGPDGRKDVGTVRLFVQRARQALARAV